MAKAYYELLNYRPQDILGSIVEKGPMFTKIQYKNILELLHRSDPNSTDSTISKNLQKLDEIMEKFGINV